MRLQKVKKPSMGSFSKKKHFYMSSEIDAKIKLPNSGR